MIDRVTVKGSNEPLELFTCDVDISGIQLDPMTHKLTKKDLKIRRVKQRLARDKYRQLTFDG